MCVFFFKVLFPIFSRENREIPVAQLLFTYDRAVVHFKIVYKTSLENCSHERQHNDQNGFHVDDSCFISNFA